MHRPLLVVLVALLGCASSAEHGVLEVPEDGPPIDGSVVVVPRDDAPVSSPKRKAPRACVVADEAPTRAPSFTSPDPTARCKEVPKRLAKSLRAEVRRSWMREWPKDGRLEIAAGCDRLGDTITRLEIESSSGHGGSLGIVRFDREAASGDYSVLWIEYNQYATSRPGDDKDPWLEDPVGPTTLRRGVVPADTMASLLTRVRAAATLEVSERPPPPVEGGLHLQGFGFSSRDFSVALRLVDDGGRGVEQFFAGYESSGEAQAQSLRLDLADAPVWALLTDEVFEATLEPVDVRAPEVHELFAEHFWSAAARGDDFGFWYLRERFLGLAATLGSAQVVPVLLAQLGREGDASVARSRVLAIHALAAITGFDRRYDAAAKPRDPATVADEVLAACAP